MTADLLKELYLDSKLTTVQLSKIIVKNKRFFLKALKIKIVI